MSTTMVISCEAGGAQILSSWIREICPAGNYAYCLQGPAEAIFRTRLGDIPQVRLDAIYSLDRHRDRVMTGTSWMPDLERRAIAMTREKGIHSISILDHWTNYRERFLPHDLWEVIPDDWSSYLPDEIWACDEYAYRLARTLGFPAERLTQIENPYLAVVRRRFKDQTRKKLMPKAGLRLLYISEPVADDLEKTYGDANYWGYTEYDLVKSLVRDINLFLKRGIDLSVRIRLHPNEVTGKYDTLIEKNPSLLVSMNADLLDDLIWADAVVGGESMALVIALLAGKQVFSVIPESKKKQCALPHREIHHVRSYREVMEYLMNIDPEEGTIKMRLKG